jgi:hypothetical protein
MNTKPTFAATVLPILPIRTVSQGGSFPTVTAQANEWAAPASPTARLASGSSNLGSHGL